MRASEKKYSRIPEETHQPIYFNLVKRDEERKVYDNQHGRQRNESKLLNGSQRGGGYRAETKDVSSTTKGKQRFTYQKDCATQGTGVKSK